MRELADRRVSFAFETTLASRSFAPWLRKLKERGYTIHIVFLWLPRPDLAVKRVSDRVRMGGHDIPIATIHRRHAAGIQNFFLLYEPIASTWTIFDATDQAPRAIAERIEPGSIQIYDHANWLTIIGQAKP